MNVIKFDPDRPVSLEDVLSLPTGMLLIHGIPATPTPDYVAECARQLDFVASVTYDQGFDTRILEQEFYTQASIVVWALENEHFCPNGVTRGCVAL